jgi:hypothetical protein
MSVMSLCLKDKDFSRLDEFSKMVNKDTSTSAHSLSYSHCERSVAISKDVIATLSHYSGTPRDDKNIYYIYSLNFDIV